MRAKSGVESAAGPSEAAVRARFLARYASYARAPTKGPPGLPALLLAPGSARKNASRARHVSRAATARRPVSALVNALAILQ